MLTKHSVLLNKIRNEKFKRCNYRCNNLAEFEEPFRPARVVEINKFIESFGLEVVGRHLDYFPSELVGRYSVYFSEEQGDEFDFAQDRENNCWDFHLLESFVFDFIPVQLELF